MDNKSQLADEIVLTVKRRGQSPVPKDFIIEAIDMVERGKEKVSNGLFSNTPKHTDIYKIAVRLFGEASERANAIASVKIVNKSGVGKGATLDIVWGKSNECIGGLEFSDDNKWELVYLKSSPHFRPYYERALYLAQTNYRYG